MIAVHDVGAAGYYLQDHQLLDLAGLIAPDVIPFLRDQPRLMEYILAHHTAYLETSAAWHPLLLQDPRVQPVHINDCPVARSEGGYVLGVYRIVAP